MSPTQLDSELVEAYFVGGPADGTTTYTTLESTGFPPAHMSIPDDDGVTRPLYSALMSEHVDLTVFQYLGPLPARFEQRRVNDVSPAAGKIDRHDR